MNCSHNALWHTIYFLTLYFNKYAMKEINNLKEKTKKKGELWLGYGRVSSYQQVID
jgi:hypothetical protein